MFSGRCLDGPRAAGAGRVGLADSRMQQWARYSGPSRNPYLCEWQRLYRSCPEGPSQIQWPGTNRGSPLSQRGRDIHPICPRHHIMRPRIVAPSYRAAHRTAPRGLSPEATTAPWPPTRLAHSSGKPRPMSPSRHRRRGDPSGPWLCCWAEGGLLWNRLRFREESHIRIGFGFRAVGPSRRMSTSAESNEASHLEGARTLRIWKDSAPGQSIGRCQEWNVGLAGGRRPDRARRVFRSVLP